MRTLFWYLPFVPLFKGRKKWIQEMPVKAVAWQLAYAGIALVLDLAWLVNLLQKIGV